MTDERSKAAPTDRSDRPVRPEPPYDPARVDAAAADAAAADVLAASSRRPARRPAAWSTGHSAGRRGRSPRQRRLGYAVYSGAALSLYDAAILGLSCRWVWRCPSDRLVAHYREHVANSHLDVGVGTAALLERARLAPGTRLALLDLNPNSLAHAAARMRRLRPETYRASVLEPIPFPIEPVGSIGMSLLLHCLPAPMAAKARAIDNVLPFLQPGGVLFGSTLLRRGVPVSAPARGLMALWNRLGIFDNERDSLTALDAALAARFYEHGIEVVGSMALFWARTRA